MSHSALKRVGWAGSQLVHTKSRLSPQRMEYYERHSYFDIVSSLASAFKSQCFRCYPSVTAGSLRSGRPAASPKWKSTPMLNHDSS